jgi:hypothetical protein
MAHVTLLCVDNLNPVILRGRSHWPRPLRRGSAAARLLGLRVRIPRGFMDVLSVVIAVFCQVENCVGLITRPEDSYRKWCV